MSSDEVKEALRQVPDLKLDYMFKETIEDILKYVKEKKDNESNENTD